MRKQTKLVAVLSGTALLAIGASMTSFARGWTQEDGEWVYLDSDGDRVTEEWKKSGSNYYWLDEDGLMATNELIEDDDDYYYVNESGIRITNQWISVDNEDDEEVDGKEVDVLWYYMGSSGQAYKASDGNNFKNSLINGRRYLFDEDGHMVSGWTEDGDDMYYLGDETEGWAYTGWQYLELDEDIEDEYDQDEAWFNFKSSGKMRKDDRVYITNAYYTFDENGVMLDDWVYGSPAVAAGAVASPGRAFYAYETGNQASGWIQTYENDDQDGDLKWYYAVSSNKNTAFNSGGSYADGSAAVTKLENGDDVDTEYAAGRVAAKVIRSKTYLFDDTGKMLTGVFYIHENEEEDGVNGVRCQGGSGVLKPGIYFFDKQENTGHQGEMQTGKTSITYDGDAYTYYFQGTGAAYTSQIKDSTLYDGYGVRVEAEDGNSNSVISISELDFPAGAEGNITISGTKYDAGTFVVSSSGKVKRNGTTTIDGVKYEVSNYFVTKAYDKDDDSETDLGNYQVMHAVENDD